MAFPFSGGTREPPRGRPPGSPWPWRAADGCEAFDDAAPDDDLDPDADAPEDPETPLLSPQDLLRAFGDPARDAVCGDGAGVPAARRGPRPPLHRSPAGRD